MSAVLGTYARQNLTFDRGEGVYLITETGERYLDFGAGIAVNALGHAHPHLGRRAHSAGPEGLAHLEPL